MPLLLGIKGTTQCIYTWNPNGAPYFEWSLGLLLEGSTTKIEDKQVPGIYLYIYIYGIFDCTTQLYRDCNKPL